jgi:hypothetical protein
MDKYKKNMPAPQWPRILLFLLLSFLILSIFFPYAPVDRLEISYSGFKKLVQEEKISEVSFQGERIEGKFDTPLTEELLDLEEESREHPPTLKLLRTGRGEGQRTESKERRGLC